MTDTEVEQLAQLVATRLRAEGHWVSFDLRVKPEVAAVHLLGIGVEGLKKRRDRKRPPFPVYNGRSLTYRIVDCLPREYFEDAA